MNPGTDTLRLWIFDFDGTLSPLVPDRTAARLHPASRGLLADLAGDPGSRVAVLSSRDIEDLARRVPVPGILLGGASGLEWRLPGGRRLRPGNAAEIHRDRSRALLAPLLSKASSVPGVDIEDKGWSIAIHRRNVVPEAAAALDSLLEEFEGARGIRVLRGPSVAEVLLLPRADKSFGVRWLCRFLDVDPAEVGLFYAGDDENDAAAMRWVSRHGGTVFCVGHSVRVPGAQIVAGPAGLVRAVREFAAALPRSDVRSGGRREAGGGR